MILTTPGQATTSATGRCLRLGPDGTHRHTAVGITDGDPTFGDSLSQQ